MVWGYGVQQEEVFTASLEKQHEGIEVINLGVAGYGTDQELILLQQEGVRYRPDLIVLVFVENDFLTNVQSSAYSIHHKPMYTMSDDGRPSLTNIPVPTQRIWERAASRIIRHSFVLNITAGAYFTFKVESLFSSSTTRDSMKSLPFPRDPEERITVALLLEIQEVAKKIGADLLLVLADGMGARGREMENFFNSRHMRILNLDPSFPQEEAKQLHLADGEHWSALGHETAANRLVKYLEDENLSAGKGSWPKRCCC